MSAPSSEPAAAVRPDLLATLRERVVVSDGAMGTMLQEHDLGLEDFEGHEGCNEILSITRPDVVRAIHDAYFEVGCDVVETNTFGSNYANLAEYGIVDRIGETALAGARLARESADAWATPDRPRWVLGSVGPGTKLPTLGHAPYALLRDAYQQQCEAMIEGGIDGVLVETSQDLLQTKAAVVGARRAMSATGRQLALLAQVTVELTGTMLLGSEIGAALTALEPLGIDVIGMNCATGPAEMGEHLRFLSQHARADLGHAQRRSASARPDVRGARRDRGQAAAAGAAGRRCSLRGTCRQPSSTATSLRSPWARTFRARPRVGQRALPLRIPTPAPRPSTVPVRLLPLRGVGETDVVAFHVVTMGRHVSDFANELFQKNAYATA